MRSISALLIEQKKPLELAEVEIPQLSYGQVLVEVKQSRICGSQLGEIDGAKGPDRWLPHLLGHEGVGIVREIGPEVSTVRVDDRVCMHWRPGAGINARPPQYDWNGKTVNAGYVTTFNQYAVVSENRLTTVQSNVSDDLACLMADTLTTGFGVVSNDAQVKIGESLCLIGCGGIGMGVIQGAALAGAYPVIAVDLVDDKLAFAKRIGATHTFRGDDPDLDSKIRTIVGQAGVDVMVDGTGVPAVIENCYKLTQPRGRTVLFGVMAYDRSVNLHTLPLHHGQVLTGSEGGQSRPDIDIPRIAALHEAGKFSTVEWFTKKGRLSEINDLIAALRSGQERHVGVRFL
ncbi:MAG: zinc-binding dehydrogenase [Opitutales bacterium]